MRSERALEIIAGRVLTAGDTMYGQGFLVDTLAAGVGDYTLTFPGFRLVSIVVSPGAATVTPPKVGPYTENTVLVQMYDAAGTAGNLAFSFIATGWTTDE